MIDLKIQRGAALRNKLRPEIEPIITNIEGGWAHVVYDDGTKSKLLLATIEQDYEVLDVLPEEDVMAIEGA